MWTQHFWKLRWNKSDLLELPHGGHVVLELVQTPESGDSQFCVLNSNLEDPLLIVRAFMSETK